MAGSSEPPPKPTADLTTSPPTTPPPNSAVVKAETAPVTWGEWAKSIGASVWKRLPELGVFVAVLAALHFVSPADLAPIETFFGEPMHVVYAILAGSLLLATVSFVARRRPIDREIGTVLSGSAVLFGCVQWLVFLHMHPEVAVDFGVSAIAAFWMAGRQVSEIGRTLRKLATRDPAPDDQD